MSRNQLAFRKRWWLLPIVVLIALGGAFWATTVMAPSYQATCGLFLSIAGDTTPAESNQASQLAQERVISYQSLIKGERVATGAIARSGVNMSPSDLVGRTETKSELNSVVISVSVSDSQAQRSAILANAVCEEFQQVAADTEAPNQQIKVKLVEKANAPRDPISPNLNQNLAFGGLVGLLIGAGLIGLWDRIWPARKSDPKPSTNGHADDFDFKTQAFRPYSRHGTD
jgi:capsular polysaccharide biosynthesis protein